MGEVGDVREVWVAVRKNRTPFAVGDTRAEARRFAGYRDDLTYELWLERLELTETGLMFWNISDRLNKELRAA